MWECMIFAPLTMGTWRPQQHSSCGWRERQLCLKVTTHTRNSVGAFKDFGLDYPAMLCDSATAEYLSARDHLITDTATFDLAVSLLEDTGRQVGTK